MLMDKAIILYIHSEDLRDVIPFLEPITEGMPSVTIAMSLDSSKLCFQGLYSNK